MRSQKWIGGVAVAALMAVPMTVSLPADGWAQVDELIVTVRKREESLQDLPIAVTAVQSATILRQGVDDLQEVVKFSPSFIYEEPGAAKDVRITVRGLSPTRGRSNVAFLVDGIDVTSEAIGTAGASLQVSQRLLKDIQRIEAVKGPQSALYGRAAFAGAIQYVTKDAPLDEFEGEVGGEYSEWGSWEVDGSVGAPIVEGILGARLTAFYYDEEGQYSNKISGADLGGGDGWGGALTLNFEPTEFIRIKGRVEYSDEEFDQRPEVRLAPDSFFTPADLPSGTPASIAAGYAGSSFVSTFGERDGQTVTFSENPETGREMDGNSLELFRASLIAEWDIDAIAGTVTFYGGYSDSEAKEDYDWDAFAVGRPDMLIGNQWINNEFDTRIRSLELRYSSDWDGPIQFTIGANYWDQERVQIERGILGNGCDGPSVNPPPPFGQCLTGFGLGPVIPGISWQSAAAAASNGFVYNQRQPKTFNDVHKSIYAMLEWELTEQWKITLESRYTEEDQEQNFTVVNLLQNSGPPFFTVTGPRFQQPESCSLFAGSPPFCITANAVDGEGGFVTTGPGGIFLTAESYVPFSVTAHSDFHTPKATLEWDINDNALLYFSAARAFKPAGTDALGGGGGGFVPEALVFEPEKLWAYEIGAKTNWSGDFGDLIFNFDTFFLDYSEKQVSVRIIDETGTPQRRTVNAAGAKVGGFEFDGNWQTPFEGLSFNFGYTFLLSEFEEFNDLTQDADTVVRAGNCTPRVIDGEDFCEVSYAGNDLEKSPKHAASLGANLTQPLFNTGIDWFVEGDAQYLGDRFTDEDNRQVLENYIVANLRAGLQAENWEALVFVDNITNDDTIKSGTNIPDFATTVAPFSAFGLPGLQFIDKGLLPPKRTVGVRARYKF